MSMRSCSPAASSAGTRVPLTHSQLIFLYRFVSDVAENHQLIGRYCEPDNPLSKHQASTLPSLFLVVVARTAFA